MPTLSVDERADFDIGYYPAIGYLYFSQPALVFEAPLTGVHYSKDAIVALAYDTPTTGAYTDIEPEMTVEIWSNGANRHGSQRIRLAATASAIYVGRCSEGTRPGELSYVSGATVRVYKERRAWAKNPYIDPQNGNQYKDERTYPGDDAAQPPVANAGADVLIISNTGSETILLDALGDVPSFAVRSGASLSSYLWDLDDGSVDSGTVNDSDLTATFGYGERYVSLTVTDDNGASHTAYKWVVVARTSDCVPAKVIQEIIRPSGVSLQLEVDTAQLPANSRPNAKIIYGIDTTHGATGSKQLMFSGWLATEQWQLADAKTQKRTVTIECHDIGTRLKMLYGFPLTVSNQSSETGWYRMPDATIDRLTHHYIQWHSNILDLADFEWSGQGSTYPLPEFTTSGASLWDQAARLAKAIGYALTCNTAGQLRVKGDPILLPTSDQNSDYSLPTQRTSTVVTTLTEADYSNVRFTANQNSPYFWVRSEAVVASATIGDISAVKCSAPGKTPTLGTSSVSETELLVTSQQELNVRAGNDYAARKNPTFSTFSFKMVKTKSYFEPADMEWLKVVLPSEERTRYPFLDASGNNFLIQEIANTYDHKKMKRASTIVAEIEIEGIPAQTIVDPPQATDQYPSYEWDDYFVPVLPAISAGDAGSGLVAGVGNILLVLSDGTIAVTTNFSAGSPSWVTYDHSAVWGSNVRSYSFRAGDSNVSAWIVSDDGIYYATQLQSPYPTITKQFSFPASGYFGNIDADYINAPGLFALCAYRASGGATLVTRTIDGGINWGAGVTLSGAGTGDFPPSVLVATHAANTGWAWGFVTTDNDFGLEQSSNGGTSFSPLLFAPDDWSGGFIVPFGQSTYMYVSTYRGATGINADVDSESAALLRCTLGSSTAVNIAAEVASVSYGPSRYHSRFNMSASDANPAVLFYVGANYTDDEWGLFATANAEAGTVNWITLIAPDSAVPYRRLALVNGGSELYLFGVNGAIAYSNSPFNSAALVDKIGNLVTSAEVIGIAGF